MYKQLTIPVVIGDSVGYDVVAVGIFDGDIVGKFVVGYNVVVIGAFDGDFVGKFVVGSFWYKVVNLGYTLHGDIRKQYLLWCCLLATRLDLL